MPAGAISKSTWLHLDSETATHVAATAAATRCRLLASEAPSAANGGVGSRGALKPSLIDDWRCHLNFTAVIKGKQVSTWTADDQERYQAALLQAWDFRPANWSFDGYAYTWQGVQNNVSQLFRLWYRFGNKDNGTDFAVSTAIYLGEPSSCGVAGKVAAQTLRWNVRSGNYSWLTDAFPGSTLSYVSR